MEDRILKTIYRYKTEEFLEKDVPFNQLEDRINELRVEDRVPRRGKANSPFEWDLFSHNVISRPDKEGKPEIVHYLIFRTKWRDCDDSHYAQPKNKPYFS